MRVVGIRDLKARLSAYLRDVGRGEVFLVTDRDRVVAELRPPRSAAIEPADALQHSIEALIEAGELTPARRPAADRTWKIKGLGLPDGTTAGLLDELRAERSGDDSR